MTHTWHCDVYVQYIVVSRGFLNDWMRISYHTHFAEECTGSQSSSTISWHMIFSFTHVSVDLAFPAPSMHSFFYQHQQTTTNNTN